jgi:hypothetical protein
MKYLKKIFENEKKYSLIEEEISSIKDIFTGLSDIDLEIKIKDINFSIYNFTNISDIDKNINYRYGDNDGLSYELAIKSVGYEVTITYSTGNGHAFSDLDFSNFGELINELKLISDRVNNYINSKSVFRLEVAGENYNVLLINFIKNDPSEEDYYYVFGQMLAFISSSSEFFKNFSFDKVENDHYLTLYLEDPEPVYLKQISILKSFFENEFETITYDSFIKIDNTMFKLKNPKIKSIKF